jgi:hypothetical protein
MSMNMPSRRRLMFTESGGDAERVGELVLRQAQRLFHPLSFADVLADAPHGDRLHGVRVPDEEGMRLERDRGAGPGMHRPRFPRPAPGPDEALDLVLEPHEELFRHEILDADPLGERCVAEPEQVPPGRVHVEQVAVERRDPDEVAAVLDEGHEDLSFQCLDPEAQVFHGHLIGRPTSEIQPI